MATLESRALRRLGTSHIEYGNTDPAAYIYNLDGEMAGNLGSIDLRLLAKDLIEIADQLDQADDEDGGDDL